MHGLDFFSNLNRKWWGCGFGFFHFQLWQRWKENIYTIQSLRWCLPRVTSVYILLLDPSTSTIIKLLCFAQWPEGSVKHLHLCLNLRRPASHSAEHDSELAWLWEGEDIVGDEDSWMLPDAEELETATLPRVLSPNPLWPGLPIWNTSALSYFESAQASKNTRRSLSILTLAQSLPWECGTSLFTPC